MQVRACARQPCPSAVRLIAPGLPPADLEPGGHSGDLHVLWSALCSPEGLGKEVCSGQQQPSCWWQSISPQSPLPWAWTWGRRQQVSSAACPLQKGFLSTLMVTPHPELPAAASSCQLCPAGWWDVKLPAHEALKEAAWPPAPCEAMPGCSCSPGRVDASACCPCSWCCGLVFARQGCCWCCLELGHLRLHSPALLQWRKRLL